jgi:L-ascorbate metabolism protein UlaG (beta-lactamase superfamily)
LLGFSVKLLGHASFQITVNGKNIYIDPYEGSYTDKADIILVSHGHHDHCDTSKIEMIRRENTVIIAPQECETRIRGNVKLLKPGEKTTVDNVVVQAVHAYNYKRFRSPGMPFHPKGSGLGFLITLDGKTVYYAGDTDFILEMKNLKNVHLALLPCGGTYTMDVPEAVEATLAINPKLVIPMHILDSDTTKFKKQIEKVSSIKVILLGSGETCQIE